MRIEFGDGIDYITSSKDQLQIQLEKEIDTLNNLVEQYRNGVTSQAMKIKIESQHVKCKNLKKKLKK